MLFRLLLLFTIVPLVELAVLVWLSKQITVGYTIALVVVTGIVGASLARWQGLLVLNRIRQELMAGRMPAETLLDGLMVFMAGALLITPGLLTDVTGFLLLVAPVRAWVRRRVANRIRARISTYRFRRGETGSTPSSDRIIDVHLVDPADSQGDERDRDRQ